MSIQSLTEKLKELNSSYEEIKALSNRSVQEMNSLKSSLNFRLNLAKSRET